MSVLEEPPVDRLPIQTYVMEYMTEMVRKPFTVNLQGGGQVYRVYVTARLITLMRSRIMSRLSYRRQK